MHIHSKNAFGCGAVFGVGFFREWFTANSRTRLRYIHAYAPNAAKTQYAGVQRRRAARKLVRRAHVNTIAAAWVITVPASACIAAVIFFALERLFGVV